MSFEKVKNSEQNSESVNKIAYKYGVLYVELLFEEIPEISVDKILNDMRAICGNVDLMMNTKDITGFLFKDYIVKYKDKSVPTQCVLFTTLNKIDKKKILPSIQQTYDWNEIEEVVEKCNYSILFSDFMGIKDDNLTRISIFNNALKSIVKNTNCKGLHFINNQKIVEPKSFVKRIDDMELSSEAFNVRFFNIEGTNDMVMDTLGLFAFGLPDLQCHFKDLDPNEIARILFNTGYYIFEKGDVIEDGHTVQGINQEDKWECRHEESLVEPKRIVLDLNPGAPHAAGNREIRKN